MDHLEILGTWIRDAESCKAWGGPCIRFPLDARTLVEDLISLENATFSLVDDWEMLTGFGQIIEKENKRLHLARLIIAPEHRGKGLGKTLCLELIREGIERFGNREFSLNVYEHNKRAVRLYESLGFRPKINLLNYLFCNGSVYMVRKSG